jgi:hypothetical protein
MGVEDMVNNIINFVKVLYCKIIDTYEAGIDFRYTGSNAVSYINNSVIRNGRDLGLYTLGYKNITSLFKYNMRSYRANNISINNNIFTNNVKWHIKIDGVSKSVNISSNKYMIRSFIISFFF